MLSGEGCCTPAPLMLLKLGDFFSFGVTIQLFFGDLL